jgi:hypothetical protein
MSHTGVPSLFSSSSDRPMHSIRICSILFVLRLSMAVLIADDTTNVSRCHQPISYDEIRKLLAEGECPSDMKVRSKRDGDTVATSNTYAVQATTIDHRKIMDDHRRIMNYLFNDTVNVTQFYQYYAEQHSSTTPIWNSWRDITSVGVLIVGLGALIYALIIWGKPLERLTSFVLRRHEKKKTPVPPKMAIASVQHDLHYYDRESHASV